MPQRTHNRCLGERSLITDLICRAACYLLVLPKMSFAQGAGASPFVGTWRTADGDLSIVITERQLKLRLIRDQGGKPDVFGETLKLGVVWRSPDGTESVNEGRYAPEQRTFTRQQLSN